MKRLDLLAAAVLTVGGIGLAVSPAFGQAADPNAQQPAAQQPSGAAAQPSAAQPAQPADQSTAAQPAAKFACSKKGSNFTYSETPRNIGAAENLS